MATLRTPSVELFSTKVDSDRKTADFILFSHELPIGEIQDLVRKLHRFAKLPRYSYLASFLHNCSLTLKAEVQKLPPLLKDSIPPFNDVLTLTSHWDELHRSPLSGAWEGTFLCIYEIAMFIGYHERHQISYEQPKCLVGVSLGLFAAAAVAVSNTLADIVDYGIQSVRTALAFCVHVHQVSQTLENTGSEQKKPATWATVVIGVPAEAIQKEIDHFNLPGESSRNDMAKSLTQVSISHVDETSVGITGPPTRLQELFRQSELLRTSRHSALPISGGLCHVPHVYSKEDVLEILENANVRMGWGTRAVSTPLISPFTGSPFTCSEAHHLVETICLEALTKPLYFNQLAGGVAAQILSHGQDHPSSCAVLHFRTSVMSENIIAHVMDELSISQKSLQCLVDWVTSQEQLDVSERFPNRTQDAKLAVVGMSCRMPGGADTPEQYWNLLMDGVDTHTTVPPDRFDLDAHFDPTGDKENTVGTRFGNFIANPGHFDSGFFNMSPREAEQTDPMQRLALVTAYEALEMSGFVPNRTPSSHLSRVGTYYGQASDDYREVNAGQKIGTYGIPGTERGFGNGRINYFFKFAGPSFNIDTACSSGLAAVQAACSALWANEVDTVVAGGLNVITSPDIYCMLSQGHFLSKTGQCKVWDINADGYCRGDGIGSVVIKRLADALADNDSVLATIVAGATNHSAESISITQPHAAAQKENYRQVMNQGAIAPSEVSFVELHGTGTQVGDAVESESVLDFFAPVNQRSQIDKRLHLGAVKSNIGHGEAAAGIASLIKVLLMYRKNVIPRHIGIQTAMNPVVARQLVNRNAGMVFEDTPWLPMAGAKKRYAIVNSFGAHGGNTTILLEDPPLQQHHPSREIANYKEVVCVSAKSKASLRANVKALLTYMDDHKGTQLRDLAYTTSARRIHHHIRIAASVSSIPQLQTFLKTAAEDIDTYAKHVRTTTQKSVVFAFSGQGCLYRGAAVHLLQKAPYFRKQVLHLDRIVRRLGFPSVMATISGDALSNGNSRQAERDSSPSTGSETSQGVRALSDSSTNTSSTKPKAESPLVLQLSLIVVQIALVAYWDFLGVKPTVVIGHSLGEYAAFVAAGVLSVADALFLAGKRVELMLQLCEAGTHTMLSVRGASVERIQDVCRGSEQRYTFEVACLNGLTDIVLAGPREDLVALTGLLRGEGLNCVELELPFAFHSAQMAPILNDLKAIAGHITFKVPKIPIISPLLARCGLDDLVIDGTYLARATREPVNFIGALESALSEGFVNDKTVWIDIGPHPVCTTFASNHYGKNATQTFASLRRSDDSLTSLAGSLAALHCLGHLIAWDRFYDLTEDPASLLHLSTYQWNHKNYWIQYEGSWTLDKAHAGQKSNGNKSAAASAFFSSSVQQIVFEEYHEGRGQMRALSDLHHPDLKGAADGHKLNGRSVVTGSIWAEIALSVGEYMYKAVAPDDSIPLLNVRDMEVFHSQVLDPQIEGSVMTKLIRIEGSLDMSQRQTLVRIYEATPEGDRLTDHAFAAATVCFEDAERWQEQWQMTGHLAKARADSLWNMASKGDGILDGVSVSTFSQSVAYQLFANVVDYAPRYRGMHRVAFSEGTLEATADIVLDEDRHGTWQTPPHWIDSTFQLAGFVMNSFGVKSDGKTAGSSRDFFFITPGWRHFRLLERLEPGPGTTYRSFVRMFAVDGEPGAFAGDMYLYCKEKLVGMCLGIKFKAVPRAMMPILFPRVDVGKKQQPALRSRSAKDKNSAGQPQPQMAGTVALEQSNGSTRTPVTRIQESQPLKATSQRTQLASAVVTTRQEVQHLQDSQDRSGNQQATACLRLISEETGLDTDDLVGEAAFADLGVDSLMSLALSAKIRAELGIEVQASIFLECPTVNELVAWLSK